MTGSVVIMAMSCSLLGNHSSTSWLVVWISTCVVSKETVSDRSRSVTLKVPEVAKPTSDSVKSAAMVSTKTSLTPSPATTAMTGVSLVPAIVMVMSWVAVPPWPSSAVMV